MISAVPVARLGGVEVRAHWSWIVVLGLITVSLVSDYSSAYPGGSMATIWIGALLTAVLIFASVAVHELAHVAVARRAGLKGNVVTVHLLGGTFVLDLQPRTPGQEFRIAIVGPAVSFVLSFVFAIIAYVPSEGDPARLFWPAAVLSAFNMLVSLVNLIPGYPLDGARIVRSIVWRVRGQEVAATSAAGRAGRYTGWGLFIVGAGLWIAGDPATALLAVIGGWVLAGAGAAVERREALRRVMTGLLVRDAIEADPPRVPPQLTLDTFASDYLNERGKAVLVARGADVLGVIGTAQATRVGARNWGSRHASEVMTPAAQVPVVRATDELWTTLELLERQRIDAVFVEPEVEDVVDGAERAEQAASAAASGEATEGMATHELRAAGTEGASESGETGAGDETVSRRNVILLTARSAAKAVTARAQQRLVAPWLSAARISGRLPVGRGNSLGGARGSEGPRAEGGALPPEWPDKVEPLRQQDEAPPADDARPADERPPREEPSPIEPPVATSRNGWEGRDAPEPPSREDDPTAHEDGTSRGDDAPHGGGGPQPGPPRG